MFALKTVSYALDIEERLITDGYAESKNSIITTYLNKGAI